MRASRRSWVRTGLGMAGAFLALLWALSGPATASPRPIRPVHEERYPLVEPRIVQTFVCLGVLTVTFDAKITFADGSTAALLDNGYAKLQLLDSPGARIPGGWRQVGVKSGGSNWLRYEGWALSVSHGARWRKARVLVGGVSSDPVEIRTGCAV